MNNVQYYQIIFADSYNTKNELINIAFKYSDSFSLFRQCDCSEKDFYENLQDTCIKRFYEMFKTIYEQNPTDEFYYANYFFEVEAWHEVLKMLKKNESDVSCELKLNHIDNDFKLLNELGDYLIQKQFTNCSGANILIGLGEQYFFKSNANTKKTLLDNFKRVFDRLDDALRDLSFYRNGNGFININTSEEYINLHYDKNEENTYRQILEDLKKLKGMQIINKST